MNPQCSLIITLLLLPFVLSFSASASANATKETYLQCLSNHLSNSNASISDIIYTPNDSSYSSILIFSLQNPRFSSPSTLKPQVIITPLHKSHVQVAIKCSKKHDIQIKVRSGGHDYEGLSYISNEPFAIIDLINLVSISIHVENKTAWVQAGATIGEVYYRIFEKSKNLAFPAGVCPTVGVGGHFSGGGEGTIMRKYGLSADNIIDAELINIEGKILDRKSMGEELFWAIRGGGAASYGVVLAWKIQLVSVPSIVTVFTVSRDIEQNGTELVHQWQYVADKFNEDLFIRVILQTVSSNEGKKTIQVAFQSLFLGGVDKLIPLIQRSFPHLGLLREDCTEMSWIESILHFNGFTNGEPLEVLLNRTLQGKSSFKAKSDYVKEPIPEAGLKGMYELLLQVEDGRPGVIFTPAGGKMNEISESEIPFPHRVGNIYQIQHLVYWEGIALSKRHINWMRRLYDYMTPYVSKNPRAAYLNYRDLDIGSNGNQRITSYQKARVWGIKYFKNNFERLVLVKTMVDPTNFFRNEQSIPPLKSIGNKLILDRKVTSFSFSLFH